MQYLPFYLVHNYISLFVFVYFLFFSVFFLHIIIQHLVTNLYVYLNISFQLNFLNNSKALLFQFCDLYLSLSIVVNKLNYIQFVMTKCEGHSHLLSFLIMTQVEFSLSENVILYFPQKVSCSIFHYMTILLFGLFRMKNSHV